MKNFAKKLALFLAFAMVVTMVHPFSVSAASKITLKSGAAAPSTIYAGHTYNLKVKGTAVKFYSSNKKIATIGATTGKMKAVAPGSVKITAKSKKTGKAVASKTFKVLQRAKSVAVDSELFLGTVGDTAKLTATLTPATSTDVVRFTTSDKTIATVGLTSGKVTAKAEGTTTINVYAKATKATSNSNKNNKVATVKVYVGAVLDTVAQTSVTELKATFKTDVSAKKFVPADFTVANKETNVNQAVKDVKVAGKDVTLTMYNAIKDGKVYTVKYGEFTAEFTATDAKTVKLDIIPKTVPINTLTEIKVVELDANGVVISENPLSKKPAYIDFSFDVTDGYIQGDSVWFNTLNSKAVAKATYHTYVYENNAETGKIETGDVTITAVAQAAVAADGIAYSISDTPVNFDAANYKQVTSLPIGKTSNVYFKIKNSDKKEISADEYAKLTFTTDKNLVAMVGNKLDANKGLEIIAVGEGTTNIVVKDAAGAVIATLPVTVGKAAVPTTLTFNKTNVTLSNSETLKDTATVEVSVKDQYGTEMTTGTVEVTAVTAKAQTPTVEGKKITFVGEKQDAGSYLYTVCYKVGGKEYLKTSYRVVIQAVDKTKAQTFAAILSEKDVETTVKDDSKDKEVKVCLGTYYGGVLDEKTDVNGESVKILSIKDSKNVDLAAKWYDATTGVITITKTVGDVTTKIPAGAYTICLQYTFKDKAGKDCVAKYYAVLTVTDKQASVTAPQIKLESDKLNVPEIIKDTFSVTYDGKALDVNKWDVNDATSWVVSPDGKTLVIKKLVVNVTVGQKKVEYAVDVNSSVALKNPIAPAATSAAPTTSEAPAATSEAPAATSEAPAATSAAPAATSAAPSETVTP